MDLKLKQSVLKLLEEARLKSDAFFVIGITEEEFFYSVDERMTPHDVGRLLTQTAPHIENSVHRMRQQKAGNR